jgi:hypothetical protein
MKGNQILKTLIPLAAVVIIIESVLLLSRSVTKIGPQTLKAGSNTLVDLSWKANSEAKMGKSEEVVLKMKTEKNVAIDAVDLYIKYDPSKVTVSGVTFDSNFVQPSFNRISQGKGLVVINYLVSAPKGFGLKVGDEVDLARLKVNYISEGEVGFEIGEGTLVVENGTASVLPFNSDSLVVRVISK